MFAKVFFTLSFCSLLLLAGVSESAQANDLAALDKALEATLSKKEIQSILKGKFVMREEEVPGHPWPIISVFAWTPTSPEEIFAVFSDYNSAKDFIPNLLKSKISKQHSPTKVEVDYCIAVPILADENYTCQNTLHPKQSDGRIQVSWSLVRATKIKTSEGFFTAKPYQGGSLVLYSNLTNPGSVAAGLLKSFARSQLRDCVRSILDKVQQEKKENPSLLQEKVREFNARLRSS
ncbi:MAG: hypothetical protein ACK5NG_10280 [Chthoniobacterales bacterium]